MNECVSHGCHAFENVARLVTNVSHRSMGVLPHGFKNPGAVVDRIGRDPPPRSTGGRSYHHPIVFAASGCGRLLLGRRAHKGRDRTRLDHTMIVSLTSWWLMEWACRRLWAQYPPDVAFHHEHRVDPLRVAMALRPVHWGRFVANSIWLQGHQPDLSDRVVVYKSLLHRDPRFIPCFYALLGRWLGWVGWGVLWPPRRERRGRLFPPTPILLLPVL